MAAGAVLAAWVTLMGYAVVVAQSPQPASGTDRTADTRGEPVEAALRTDDTTALTEIGRPAADAPLIVLLHPWGSRGHERRPTWFKSAAS